MKLLIAAALLMLSGCAVLTPGTPSLHAYLIAHAAGVATATETAAIVVAGEQVYINTREVVKDVKADTKGE